MKKSLLFLLSLLGVFFANRSVAQCSPNTVPYYEGFSGITSNNQLPACWSSSNPSITCQSFASPLQCAAFHYSPAATSYFFTEAIQLNSGVNYSISLWYKVSSVAPGNWSKLVIMMGTSQATLGMINLVSTTGVLTNTNFVALTGTFSAPSSNAHYFSIGATGDPSANAQYLYWDDLEITMPCSINPVNLVVSSSPTALCAGECATLTASGADTYLWSNSSVASSIVVCPVPSTSYSVIGTNSITTCTTVVSKFLNVNPSPVVGVLANPTMICEGETSQLQAFGASSYTWSTNENGNAISANPTLSTTYTVTGGNSFSCTNSATLTLTVDACLGLHEKQMEKFLVFPNPLSESLHVEFEAEKQVCLVICDINGKAVYGFSGKVKDQVIDTKFLSQGIYTLKLETEGSVQYQKLIKN